MVEIEQGTIGRLGGVFTEVRAVHEGRISHPEWSTRYLVDSIKAHQCGKEAESACFALLQYSAPGVKYPFLKECFREHSVDLSTLARTDEPDWKFVRQCFGGMFSGVVDEADIGRFFAVHDPGFWLNPGFCPVMSPALVTLAVNGLPSQTACGKFLEAAIRRIEVKKSEWFGVKQQDAVRLSSMARLSHLLIDASRVSQDWRFLNTALKVNDWMYPAVETLFRQRHRIRWGDNEISIAFHYGLGVAKQERCLKEASKL